LRRVFLFCAKATSISISANTITDSVVCTSASLIRNEDRSRSGFLNFLIDSVMSESGLYRVTDYWNQYFNWRLAAGLDDAGIREVVRNIRQMVRSHEVSGREAARLKKLARMIEVELESVSGMSEGAERVA